jgi:hypothetical protein
VTALSYLAIIYALITVLVVIFQICLTLGAPWGELTMGGVYKGKLPRRFRVFAFIQSLLYCF